MALYSLLAPLALMLTTKAPAPGSPMSIHIDNRTGAWTGMSIGGRAVPMGFGSEAGVQADGAELPGRSSWRLIGCVPGPADRVCVTWRAGEWEIVLRYRVTGADLRRDVTFRWLGARPVTVRGAWLATPPFRLSADPRDVYEIPGNFPVTRRAFGALRPGDVSSEQGWTRGDYAVVLVSSGSARRYVAAGYAFTQDQARISVHETASGVSIRHSFDCAVRLEPGGELTCGTQILRGGLGARASALRGLEGLCGAVGNGPPADRPANLDRNVILEAHPWGRLESWGTGDRGNRYDRLTELAPYWHDLGVTCVWMLPLSWPPPWVYTLPAFDRVAPENGSPEALKGFVSALHARKMRALVDLVVYGVLPSSPEVQKLPADVWCQDESGNPQIVWGGAVLAADCANPAWQRKMREVARHWASAFGFDGARLDCIGWGQTPNWARKDRASTAVAAGGIALNGIVRSAFRQGNPEAFLLPEGGKPLVFQHSDMVFDYPFYLALRDGTVRLDRARWIADLREWMEYERLCYPARARQGLVRFLELHDTVSAAEYFGVGPSQALMALCVFAQGTPLIQQEQETGFAADLRRWLRLRNATACLRAGEADYVGVRCTDPSVIAFTRAAPSGAAVVAVNLSGRDVACDLAWPTALSRRFPAMWDVLRCCRVRSPAGRARVTIPAFRPAVLLLTRGAAPSMEPAAAVEHPAAAGAWRESESGGLVVENCASWRVNTAEGVLEDRFFDQRSRVRPNEPETLLLPVLARSWNPLAYGLLDGAASASIVLTQRDGRQVRALIDSARLTQARILNPRADGRSVEVRLTPRDAWNVERPPTAVAPAGSADAPAVDVDPWFVTVRTDRGDLVLARRHGGVPIAMRTPSGAGAFAAGGDLYTDFGLVPNRGYAGCDGETNARLSVQRVGSTAIVTFTGAMRERAWNGVAPCWPVPVGLAYTLRYEVTRSGRITVRISVIAPGGIKPEPAFLALRVPLAGYRGCRVDGEPVTAAPGSPRIAGTGTDRRALLSAGTLRWSNGEGLSRSFVVPGGDGQATLFLAVLDGDAPGLAPGVERAGSATIEFGDAVGGMQGAR